MNQQELLELLVVSSPNKLTARFFKLVLQGKGKWPFDASQLSYLLYELQSDKPRKDIWRKLEPEEDACSNGCQSRCVTCGHCACGCWYCLRLYKTREYPLSDSDMRFYKHHKNRQYAVKFAIENHLLEKRSISYLNKFPLPFVEEIRSFKKSERSLLDLSFLNLSTMEIRVVRELIYHVSI
jgi:hypothetical protein